MLPNDWIHTTFEKHIDLLNGFAFKSVNYSSDECDIRLLRGDNIEPGSLRWRGVKRWPANELEKLNKFQLAEHDFVIAMDRTWITSGLKVAEVKQSDLPCLLVQRVSRIRALPTLNQSLLRQYFSGHRFEQYVKSVQTETAVPHISPSQIKEFSFLLPPLPEQRKIAEILSTWDKAISTTERLIDNSKQQKKALMQQLLTGQKRLLDDSGKPFDGAWESITLNSIFPVIDSLHQTPTFSESGYSMIRVTDIKGSSLSLKNALFVNKDVFNAYTKKYAPKRNDIVFSRVGSYGNSTIVKTDTPFCLGQNTVIASSNDSADSDFIYQFLNTDFIKKQIERTVDGSSHKTVSLKIIRNLILLLPSVKEQQKVSAALTNADKEVELLEQQLADLKQEKKALMQQLLTGKRRVKTK